MSMKRLHNLSFISIAIFTLVIASLSYALVDKTQNWLPLQQIAINSESNISVDENNNGIVDNAEKLGGLDKNSFLQTQGGTLRGILFLYYGVGKIVDLDNPSYYIDPSYYSNFNRLCIKGVCINSWNDIQTNIDENYIRSIARDEIYLQQSNITAGYAENLVGINKNDLLEVSKLRSFCLNRNCSLGMDAVSVNGYKVGSNISNIPIIDPTILYDNLKVGYSSFSSLSNNTYRLGGVDAETILNDIEMLKTKYTIIEENLTVIENNVSEIYNTLRNIFSYIGDNASIVLNGLKDSEVQNYLFNLLDEEGYLKINNCFYNEGIVLITQDESGSFTVVCKRFKDSVKEQVMSIFKNKLCSGDKEGVVIGFNREGDDVECISYSSLANKMMSNIVTSLESQGFLKGDTLAFNTAFQNEIKSVIDNYLGSYLTRNTGDNRYLKKNYCSNDKEILVYNSNNRKFECKRLELRFSYSFENTKETYPEGGDDNEIKAIRCDEKYGNEYVMVGVSVQYEDVNDGWGDTAVIHKIGIICKKLDIDGELRYLSLYD